MTGPILHLHGSVVRSGGYRDQQPLKEKPRLEVKEIQDAKIALVREKPFDTLEETKPGAWDRFLAFFNVFRWVVLKIYLKAKDGTEVPTYYKVNYSSFKKTFPHLSNDEIKKQLGKSRDVTDLLNRFVSPAQEPKPETPKQAPAKPQPSGTVSTSKPEPKPAPAKPQPSITVSTGAPTVSQQKFEGTDYDLGAEILKKISEGLDQEAEKLVEQAKSRGIPVENAWKMFKSNPEGIRELAKGLTEKESQDAAKQHIQNAANKGVSYANALLGDLLSDKALLEQSLDCSKSNLELGKKENDHVKAEQYFLKATQDNPGDFGMNDVIKAEAYAYLSGLKESNPKEAYDLLIKAKEFMEKDVKRGHPHAQFLLARGLMKGFNLGGYVIKQDLERAQELWEKSLSQGNWTAGHELYNLSLAYRKGNPNLGIPHNFNKYVEIMDKLAERGDRDALFLLGTNYCWGTNLEKQGGTITIDLEKGERYLTRAADLGHKKAAINLYFLGDDYRTGNNNVPMNFSKYVALMEKAVKCNDPNALYWYGRNLYQGRDYPEEGGKIEKDPERGKGYLEKLAKGGDQDAQEFIAKEKSKGMWDLR